jgi:regulator of sigma E protease
MTIALVIVILFFLILVHELGHFAIAKLFGVRVEEFGIGYPPRALSLGTWGGTEYTLNWIPFGGFVRLFGEGGEEGDGSYTSASRSARAAILIAGVAMNAIIGWALFVAAYGVGLPRAASFEDGGTRLVVERVLPDSPADRAGLVMGDEIKRVATENGLLLEMLSPNAFAGFVEERGGEDLIFEVRRGEEEKSFTITPAHGIIPESGKAGIGVALFLIGEAKGVSLGEAFSLGSSFFLNSFPLIAGGLYDIVLSLAQGEPRLDGVAGPVGLVGVVADAEEQGMGTVLLLAGVISINLVLVNLIPIPVLDGGRLLILGVEALFRRTIPGGVVRFLNLLGVAFVFLLMIFITWHDVANLL